MRILFAVDSFFQLIEATNLRMSIYCEDKADIAIYSSTPSAKKVCESLKKTGVFDNCYYVDTSLTRCSSKYSFFDKLPKYFVYLYTIFFSYKYTRKLFKSEIDRYDQFLFVGYGALPECIYNACKKVNRDLVCYRYEDSYVSYTKEYVKSKGAVRSLIEKIGKIVSKRNNIVDDIKGYYFISPDLVQISLDYPIIEAPRIDRLNSKLVGVLNEAFGFDTLKDNYKEKYIFFESGDSFFEANNEDVQFIKELAAIVGGDNILVKRHPRCTENRFKSLGVHIAKSSNIPWELIQMNIRMDNKVFITTTSAAALSSLIYFGDNSKTIMLYEAMKSKPASVTDVMRRYMDSYQN